MGKTAVILTNYNMPEKTDAIVGALKAQGNSNYYPVVIDNGSDLREPSRHTELRLPKNRQTTAGWLAGWDIARHMGIFDSYVFTITSIEIPDKYPKIISRLRHTRAHKPNAVILSPALTANSTTAWKHMHRQGEGLRKTWMVDNLFAFYDASWFDHIGGFDYRFIYGWGVDLETSYLARRSGHDIYIDDSILIKKTTNIGYEMNRMNMSAEDRVALASANMDEIMTLKYGENWRDLMYEKINF